MKNCIALLVVFALASVGRGESVAKITVDPDVVPRTASPVIATLVLPKPTGGGIVTLRAEGHAPVEAQLVTPTDGKPSILWIEPNLAAGKTRTYDVVVEKGEQRAGFAFKDGEGFRDLNHAGKGVLRYMNRFDPADFDSTFKPFHMVFNFQGDDFITKAAGGSFTHHRGLFFGFNKTQFGDFWHCREGVSQRFDRFVTESEFGGPIAAREVSVVNWDDKEGTPVARDTRDVTTWRVSDTQLVLDWTITLEALKDEGLKLDGDPQHAGFHFRAAQEVAVGAQGTSGGTAKYVRPTGAKFTRNDEWVETPWVSCSFNVKNKPYNVVMFDNPDNPRKDATYSTRAYGRFGAFFRGEIAKGKPLVLRYRVIVFDGEGPGDAALATLYADYIKPVTVTVR